jgi:hypothetical protein
VKVVCAWCIRDRRAGFLRDKAPFEDPRETHGLCEEHFRQVKSHNRASAGRTSLTSRLITELFSPVSAWLHHSARRSSQYLALILLRLR